MAYTKTTWVDNSPPAINADNLNKIENGIEDHEQRIEALEQGIEDIEIYVSDTSLIINTHLTDGNEVSY